MGARRARRFFMQVSMQRRKEAENGTEYAHDERDNGFVWRASVQRLLEPTLLGRAKRRAGRKMDGSTKGDQTNMD
jgi:hypothetical protein